MRATRTAKGRKTLDIAAGVIAGVCLLVAAAVAYVLASPVDANDFESTTGVAWADFSAANPEVAQYLVREARLLAVGYLGLMLLATVIAWTLLRAGNRWAARALWLLPVTLLGAVLVFFASDGAALGAMYLVVSLVITAALVVAHRSAEEVGAEQLDTP